MAKGVLPREWDGFILNRFHCTADTVAPEWKSSLFSLWLSFYKRSSWVSVLRCTAVTKFAQTFKCRCFAGVTCSKAAHIWRLYLLLFGLFRSSSSSSSSAAIICLCVKLVQWGTSVRGSCWLRDLGKGFRGNQWTKPWVTDEQIGLFAPLWFTCTALKRARCVSLAISRGKDWWSQLKRSVFGECAGGKPLSIVCWRKKLNVTLKLVLILVPYNLWTYC